uniref:RWD domain-containing protein n=1 Tax=Schistocephalus solidus TaxID=70667 RepID=A0A183TPE6_SCHSO
LIESDKPRLPSVTLRFTFGPGYPSSACPTFTITAPELPRSSYDDLTASLWELCCMSVGSPVIHCMVEAVRQFLEEFSPEKPDVNVQKSTWSDSDIEVRTKPTSDLYCVPSVRAHLASTSFLQKISEETHCPEIFHGEPITDRKSVFQAHCCRVSSLQEVSLFIRKMLEDGKVASATHNITAWYLRAKLRDSSNTLSLVADFDDDGETHAGARLLHLLMMAANEGVAVMVSRWFGGIKLGPDRFKHINSAASSLLAEQKMLKAADPPRSKTKHKGKR